MEVKTFPPREMKNISISYHTKLFPSFLLRMRILQRSQIKNFNRNPSKRQLHILLEQKKRRQKEIANNFLHCFWNVEQSLHCDGNHKKSKKQRAGKAKPQSSFSFVDKAIRWQTENGMQYSSSSSWSETDNSIKANNKRKLHCSFVETINRSVCVCARNWYCSFQKLFHVLRATIVRDRTRDRDEIESQLPSVFFVRWNRVCTKMALPTIKCNHQSEFPTADSKPKNGIHTKTNRHTQWARVNCIQWKINIHLILICMASFSGRWWQHICWNCCTVARETRRKYNENASQCNRRMNNKCKWCDFFA